jgi:hypothetical protein
MSNSESSGYRLRSSQPVEIRVYDSDLRPVDRGVGTLERKDLPPGIYRVELRAGASSDERLIRLEPGQIYEDLELQLSFASVIPLPSTRTFDQQHLAALQDLSVKLRVPSTAATSELVVFIRVVSTQYASRSDIDFSGYTIQLLDANLNLVPEFSDALEVNQQQGWCGVSAGVEAGGHLLRIESTSVKKTIDQALFLPAGWQTVVCVPMGPQGPMLEASSIQMLPTGQGGFMPTFELNMDLALSLEVATTGLAAGRSLVPRAQIRELLARKFWNPMLGIIGAYCMFDPATSRSERPSSTTTNTGFKLKSPDDEPLLKEVLDNLNSLMPGHPDVAAIAEFYREATGVETRSPQPVAWPPTMAIGYKQLASVADVGRAVLEENSLAARACSWLTPCGPWTAWPSDKTAILNVTNYASQKFFSFHRLRSARPSSSASNIIGRYIDEISKTEEQPRDLVLSKLSDEFLSANTGLPISAVRAARMEPAALELSEQREFDAAIDFDPPKEQSSS